jgi:hypothetical protein
LVEVVWGILKRPNREWSKAQRPVIFAVNRQASVHEVACQESSENESWRLIIDMV